jgi:hypothetical protein
MKFVIFILIIFTIKVAGQQPATFVKIFDFNNKISVGNKCMKVEGNEIFINYVTLCNQKGCSGLVKIDSEGKIVWQKLFSWTNTGNRNTIALDEEDLYLCNKDYIDNKHTISIIKINKENGDSLNNLKILNTSNIVQLAIDGCIINKENIIINGWIQGSTDTVTGILQWINKKGEIGILKEYRIPKNQANSIYDLTVKNNNLHFIMFNRQIGSGFEDSRRITTTDSVGQILSSFDYGHNNAGIFVPVGMTITPEDDFVFTAWQPDSIFGGGTTPQLVKTDKIGNVKWYYNWESSFFGQKIQYTISDVQMAKNGDIIGCGYIFKGYYDGYIFRMSGDGTMLWERRYNILDSLDTKFDAIFLNNVGEDSEGNIIASGSHTNSFNFDDKVVLIKTNADGCIDSIGCEYRTIIEEGTVSVGDISDSKKNIIYPNPSSSSLFLNKTMSKPYSYSIYNLLGEKISYKEMNSNEEIDISLLPDGNYLLSITDRERTYQVSFIKI